MWYRTRLLLFCLLILPVQSGQAQASQKAVQASDGVVAEIPPDTPIITIDGLCASDLVSAGLPTLLAQHPASTTKPLDPGCETVITRGQYEQLVAAIGGKSQPGSPPNFARQLVDMLLYAQKGREISNDMNSAVEEKLRYSFLQTIAQQMMTQMQRQANDITDADVEKYFKEHPERFVRVHLQQISVPKRKDHDDPTGAAKAYAAEQDEMHQLAFKIREEAAAGGNIDRLEEKAYKAARDESVPDTDLGEPVQDEVPLEFRKVIFDLQAGQVSTVVENDHEYLIYKCVEKHTVQLSDRKKLYSWLRMRDAKQSLQDMIQTQFNPDYFEVSPEKSR